MPGFLHTLCGIRINTGQPECKLDEDHTEKLADLKLRLKVLSSQANDFIKKLQQVEAKLGQTKAEDDAAKKELATKKSACKQSQVTCRNVARMASALNEQSPKFLADGEAPVLSWKPMAQAGQKRAAEGGQGGSRRPRWGPAAGWRQEAAGCRWEAAGGTSGWARGVAAACGAACGAACEGGDADATEARGVVVCCSARCASLKVGAALSERNLS